LVSLILFPKGGVLAPNAFCDVVVLGLIYGAAHLAGQVAWQELYGVHARSQPSAYLDQKGGVSLASFRASADYASESVGKIFSLAVFPIQPTV